MSEVEGKLLIGWAREDGTFDVLVKTLACRVVIEGVSWDIEDALEHMWTWAGPNGEPNFKLGSEVELRGPSGRPLRLHGKIAGKPLEPEARMYRKILLAFDQADLRPSVVLLARDGDGSSKARRRGFVQVMEGLEWSFEVILAMPEPESEAWFVCGFVPASKPERDEHTAVCRELGFDPVRSPHRLTFRPNDAKTDAKRVLDRLLGDGGLDRREQCLNTPLETLSANGAGSGLTRFIEDLRAKLLPRVDPGAIVR